jgi:hypothetical protein
LKRPACLMFETLHTTADPSVALAIDGLPEHPLVQPLLAAYTFDAQVEDFRIYRRTDRQNR